MTDNMASAESLGYEPPKAATGGLYVSLRSRGDSARMRLVSRPYKFTEVFEDNGKERQADRYAWVVIHKEMVNGKPTKTVRAFKAGTMIYRLIYDLVCSLDWGNPAHYDILITRTEEKGRYYTIAPIPKPMGPISEQEQQMVAEAGLDLAQMFSPDGRANQSESDDEGDPFADAF